ncbi:MAG: AI-2E family transporter, partial [Verrucomicrobiae bacterium]|nr:AI-2E family transporter [Verrucomicrobiae bacterium]
MPETDEKTASSYPNRFQKQTLWTAITAVSFVVILAIAVGAVMGTSWILGYLNPILVPVAVAGILAYLLDPLIGMLTKRGMKPKGAFYTVFLAFNGFAVLLAFLVIKPAVSEGRHFWNRY